MKKRLFTSILSILLLVAVPVVGFTGCDMSSIRGTLEEIPGMGSVIDKVTEFGDALFGKEEVVEASVTLDATSKALKVGESCTLTATATPADAEIVWSSSDEAVVTVEGGVVLAVGEGTAIVTATNGTASATCEITVTKVEVEKHTVTFKNGETQLKSIEVEEGGAIAYVGTVPSKAATEQYSYTFSGWSLTDGGEVVDISKIVVDGDKTLYAVFAETLRSYTVTWNIDGATTNSTVAYGVAPEYKDVTPTKPTVGNTSYTFKGWATSLSGEVLETLPTVTGDVIYYAIFDEVTAQTKFTVTWMNGDTVWKTDVDVAYETIPVYTGETPTKEMTTEWEYVFAGWAASADGDKLDSLPEVTANATYYAVFEATARKYTITWVIEGVEKTTQCGYGSVPAYDGTPTKADSEECSYKFDGWALSADGEKVEELPVVSGEATYYATFVVDVVFEVPKFVDGKITYSANSQEIFLPEGLLAEGVSIENAVVKAEGVEDVIAYENGEWIYSAITLTEEELKGNLVGVRTLHVKFSNGDKLSVDMLVYAGIIDELSDFPKFFNNEAVENQADNAADFPMVAPDTYGYYIVTKDLGTGVEELALTQTALTNYQKTNGFNGVLDGQGHTLRFKLMSGGLVGLVLGNAVIKNLAVIYEDASFISQGEGGGYGAFGYITNGSPEIRNCYIERTNNVASRSSVFGIMARPNAKLILHNTVVYGYLVPNDATWWSNTKICPASTNAYVIHGRANATSLTMAENFTKVYNDAIEEGSRDVPLSDIEDASGFDDNYWSKENGKLIWKGFETVNVTWVKGDETTVETVTKGDWILYTQTLPADTTSETESVEYYWSLSEDGEKVKIGDRFAVAEDVTYYMVTKKITRLYTVTWNIEGVETTTDYEYNQVATHETPVKEEDKFYSYEFKGWSLSEDGEIVELGAVTEDGIVYYAVFEKTAKITFITVNEAILYSTDDGEIMLPAELPITLDETVKIASADDAIVYYENGEWVNTFAITDEQRKANAIGLTEISIQKGTDWYLATVKSYAGVIDELSDFPKFFNNDPNATHAKPYGYYIVTKDLGTGAEELTFTQSTTTDYKADCGFNGILDGAGHTLKFKLMSGGLVGLFVGNGTIKNLSVIYADETSTQYGVFGYMTNGNPVIDNCYIERTNNKYQKWSVFGIMSRPNAKLELHNTVVYGYNISNECAMNSNMWISANSTNAYLIHARANATGWVNVQGFTKVFTDAIENGSREVLLSEIADDSGFNSEYWYKENGKLIWKGFETVNVTWVKGDETTVETVTKGDWILYTQTLPADTTSETETVQYYWSLSEDGEKVKINERFAVAEDVTYYMVMKQAARLYTVTWNIDGVETTTEYNYNDVATHEAPVKEEDDFYTYEFKGWSLSEDGELVELGAVTEDGIVYYAVFESTAKMTLTTVSEAIMYSTDDSNLFLPEELTLTLDETVTIESQDGTVVYYENGEWVNTFAITEEQRKANLIATFDVSIEKGTDVYLAKVNSYAGVIDELSDFPAFFNNTAVPSEFDAATYPAVAPNVYGYYIVTKDLGSATDELALTQTEATDYQKTNGFNGVLDGAGHTLRFKLMSGGLVGMVLGNAVIKNIGIIYEDGTYDSATKKGGYGVFGYITNGSPEIRNSYIERTNNLYHQGSVFGIMARPNAKLILHNTAVHGNNTSNNSGWYSNMWINETSTNAYLIYAREAATGYDNSKNFTGVSTGNTFDDLSSFDTNYWNINGLSWKSATPDKVFSSVIKVS